MAVGEQCDFFGEAVHGARRRQARHVGEEVVYLVEPRRVYVADGRHLHGRGALREYRQARALRVAGEIDEDVDAVFEYLARGLERRHLRDVAPVDGVALKSFRDLVGAPCLVAVDVEVFFRVRGEERREEARDGVLAKIGRYVADADFPVRQLAVFGRRVRHRDFRAEECVVALAAREEFFVGREIIREEKPHAVERCFFARVAHESRERKAHLRRLARPRE